MIKLITTATVGFLFRALDEYEVPSECEVVPMEEYIKDPSRIDPSEHDLKDERKLQKIEENKMWMERKRWIHKFLMDRFSFNPDKHVRIGYWPSETDPERDPVTTKSAREGINIGNTIRNKKGKLRGTKLSKRTRTRLDQMQSHTSPTSEEVKVQEIKVQEIKVQEVVDTVDVAEVKESDVVDTVDTVDVAEVKVQDVRVEESESDSDYDSGSDMEEDDSGYDKGSVEDVIRNVLPSADYFYHFSRFLSRFYKPLHKGTIDLYAEKHDVDIAFAIWDQYTDENEANEFRHKHKNDSSFVINTIRNNGWVFTGPWEQNKERMEYYNKNTDIMKAMIDKKIEDNKMVEDMVHNRVRIAKEKNVAEVGPDSDAWLKYSSANRPDVASMGALNINSGAYAETDKPSKSQKRNRRRRKKSKPLPLVDEKDSIEIDVISLSKGGKEMKIGKMHTRAVAPDAKNLPAARLSGSPASYS